MLLPPAEFLPDQPDFPAQGSGNVLNVLPRTASSYGPMPSLAVYSSALGSRCQGALPAQDSAGNVRAFAGDATDLWRLVPGTTTWAKVSKSAGVYTIPTDQAWRGCQFGDRIMMTDYTDAIQSYVEGVDTLFSDLAAAAPKARFLTIARDFVVAGNTSDGTFGTKPRRLWWSAINDPTNWPTLGTSGAAAVQSDAQDIEGDHGELMGLVGNLGTADIGMFFERAIWRGVYVGAPNIFNFTPAEGLRGTPAPGSVAQLGAFVIYLGEDGFYMFDGSNSAPLGAEKVDKFFFGRLDQTYFYRISAVIDPINKIYFCAYPGPGNSGGNPNEMLAYNWSLKRWSWITGITCELLLRSLSFGYTLDQLDTVNASLDALPFSLDSRAWTGGRLLLSAFDTNHKLNYFTGAALAPQVDSSEVQIIPGRRAFVSGIRPLVDGGAPTIAVGVREKTTDTVTFGSAVAVDVDGQCPQRASARYHRARIELPAGSSFTHISGAEIPDDNIADDGER